MAGKKLNTYAVEAYLKTQFKDVSHPENRDIEHTYLNLKINDDTFVDFYETGKIRYQGPNASEVEQKLEAFKEKWNAPKVFVVFAHDRGGVYAENVAKAVEAVGLEPIMLKDQPNNSRSVLEKLQKHFEECQYTIVIATQDEKVQADEAIYRTRPNVMLELGIVLGRAWSTKTDANVLIFNEGDVIKGVSDISGLTWESVENIQDDSTFHEILYKEFKAAGLYNI